MATKKKKKVGSHRRRPHKVGAAKPGSIEHYALLGLGAIAGAIGGAYAVQALQTAFGTTAPPFLAPGAVGVGGLGVALIGKGAAIAEGAGLGMLAIGSVMAANQTFLNVPGISGMAMTSNASPATNVLRRAVGQGPKNYLNRTVGYMTKREKAIGALVSM